MQPCSREENTMSSILSPSSTHSSQIQNASFDPSPPHDDFLDQILSTLPSGASWSAVDPTDETTPPSLHPAGFHSTAASHFSDESDSAVFASNLRQQIMMIPSFLQHGIDRNQNDISGFSAGSLHHPHQFHNPQDLGGNGAVMSQGQGQSQAQQKADASTATGATPAGQTKPRVRARRGQATDPHSIAERLRRERIAERMKGLQELVPNANKTDKASMLDEIIDYVKFLQLQVKVLSMSRLGGAASGGPLASQGGGGSGSDANRKNKTASSGTDAGLTVTENQVAKLMREDMGSAMQYLQGKGLCLMPISLATAISTSTCRFPNPLLNAAGLGGGDSGGGAGGAGTGAAGDVPTSPDISALSVSKQ